MDPEYSKMAEPYRKDMDFAFFAAYFGYSKSDYEALTPREVLFLRKAWEDKLVSESYLMYNAVYTAIYNANRPKNRRARNLFTKSRTQRVDENLRTENIQCIHEAERNDGNWLERLRAWKGGSPNG